MPNYTIRRAAELDLIRIHAYGKSRWGEQQADEYFRNIFAHFDKIAEQPLMFPTVEHLLPGYRRSVCGNESIYYTIVGGTVEITAVIGHQDTNRLKR